MYSSRLLHYRTSGVSRSWSGSAGRTKRTARSEKANVETLLGPMYTVEPWRPDSPVMLTRYVKILFDDALRGRL